MSGNGLVLNGLNFYGIYLNTLWTEYKTQEFDLTLMESTLGRGNIQFIILKSFQYFCDVISVVN